MNILLLALVMANNHRVNTSFYTYHRIGGYSVTDFYVDYLVNRYDLRLAMEKRHDRFGLKSIALEIDSVVRDFRLTLGEKPYHTRAPASTNLNLWGLSVTSHGFDFFGGKLRDNTAALPPTFSDNKYTVGARVHQQFLPRIPLDFYLMRRSDTNYRDNIRSNNSAGVNSEMKLGDNLAVDNKLWVSHTEQGIGAGYEFNGKYTVQKYGGHCHVTVMSRDYVPFASVKTQPGTWLRLNTYQRPSDWLGFSQDLGYTSLHDTRLTLNTRLSPLRFPVLTYSISFSKQKMSQVLDGEWYYKSFSVSANYEWSSVQNAYGLRLAQRVLNCQIWSGFKRRDSDVWQFGFMFPFPKYIRFKGFVNYAKNADYYSSSTGFELSSRFLKDLNINLAYEYIQHNSASEQLLSFSISKTFDFERVGLSFISGRVYMDVNNNGMYDFGDKAMSDIDVVIDGKSEAKTDKNGVYMFPFVRSGRHAVYVDFGCMPAEIGTASRTRTVDTRLLSQARIDFPLEVLGSLSGTVYYDHNNNGERDQEDDGVPNVVLALNGYLTATDKNGEFRFANLAAGTYVLEPKLLPPETFAARQEQLYLFVKPGADFAGYELRLIKQERPVDKKVFD